MSIASELNALNGYILGAYDEISTMGGTIPTNKNMSNLASAIATIPSGGGGSSFLAGSFTTPSDYTDKTYTITHNMNAIPKLFICLNVEGKDQVKNYNSSTPSGGVFWICLTSIPTGGNSGWAPTNPWLDGLFAKTGEGNCYNGTYGFNSTHNTLKTATTGAGYYFNMDETTATIKSQNNSRPIGASREFIWMAFSDLSDF